jgi:nucleoside-diphosphate-sugar epimerase
MRRVLVTGASGFIGRRCLAPLAERGCEVIAVSSRATSECQPVRWVQCDLLEPGAAGALFAAEQPDALLHLAWYAVPGRFWEAPENFAWVRASLSLLEAFTRSGGRRVVTAGSCAEYDWSAGICSETETALQPATIYGSCKHELQVLQSALCRQSGVSHAWGRVFLTYGPGEPRQKLVASVIDALLAGRLACCTHGRQVRDLMHAQDVADALVALLASDVEGPVNIASGAQIALREVICGIADRLDRPDLVRLGELSCPANDPPTLTAAVARLHDEVGWQPAFDLSSGLDDTIAWHRGRALSAGCRSPIAA